MTLTKTSPQMPLRAGALLGPCSHMQTINSGGVARPSHLGKDARGHLVLP
jgi:hypothetical protein